MEEKINREFDRYCNELYNVLGRVDPIQINNALDLLRDAKTRNSEVYIIGNGGSASTAEHWANDLLKLGRVKAVPLTNLATVSAFANDVNYSSVFIEQLKIYLKKDDILVGITGSGNSPNILEALRYVHERGEKSIGILGFDGGKAKDLCSSVIQVNSNDYGIIEDVHMTLGHYLARRLKE
ncbi:Phosphoheptose isomerase [uncultured archaeon]|nr:Phosphoheptose isomerase [uncultured archaeon]